MINEELRTPYTVSLSGSPFERGRQYGEALRGPIREFLGDGLARINHIRNRSITRSELLPRLALFASVIHSALPKIDAELRGLAAGADIDYLDAVLLQTRREILADMPPGPGGDCSTVAARTASMGAVVAQTIDLPGRLSDMVLIMDIAPAEDDAPRMLVFSFVGLLGYLGMNSRGLGVGINMVLSDGWRPGVPPYLLVRHLLEQTTVEACLMELARIPRSSSRCFTIADSRCLLQIEATPDDFRVISGESLVHTNHYLHDELLSHDVSKGAVRYSSEARLRRLSALWASSAADARPERIFEILSDHGDRRRDLGLGALCIHGGNDLHCISTVGAVCMYPARGELHLRHGYPCLARHHTFHIARDIAQ